MDGRKANTFSPQARMRRNYLTEDLPDRPLQLELDSAGEPVFDRAMIGEAMFLAMQGRNDVEIAKWFGISTDQLNRWKIEHVDFERAIEKAKDVLHGEALQTIRTHAVNGYKIEEEIFEVGDDGEPRLKRKKVKHMPPSREAALTLAQATNPDTFGVRAHTADGRNVAPQGSVIVENLNVITDRIPFIEQTKDKPGNPKKKKAVVVDG